jgi:hypothetical protein
LPLKAVVTGADITVVATATKTKSKSWTSRAVSRPIEPGNSAMCSACDEQVKFQARVRLQQVICNVYVNGRWNRVEHYHAACYDAAGQPYGSAA